MLVIPAKGTRTMLVSFKRGEYILESLTEFLEKEKADAGLITSGIGSLDILNYHTITTSTLPPGEEYLTVEGPIEICSLIGSIAGGKPHIHLVAHHTTEDKIHIGHLEPGSRCCFRVELGLILFEGVRTRSEIDPETGLVDIVMDDSE